jgi:16S rRNA (uracil1498-N3)-methyltransferase
MVERDDHAPVATFFTAHPVAAGNVVTLDESAAHHARVKRLAVGNPIELTDGVGSLAMGPMVKLRRDTLEVSVDSVRQVPKPSPIHLCVPIGDRDRTLLLAEKATELGITSWQSVRFRRSASVVPRAEGKPFRSKLRARMIAALEQSRGGWLPEVRDETALDALPQDARQLRIVLDGAGPPLLALVPLGARRETVLLFGPEGGMEREELELVLQVGWRAASLAPTVLRFETAGIAAVAALRAASLKEN